MPICSDDAVVAWRSPKPLTEVRILLGVQKNNNKMSASLEELKFERFLRKRNSGQLVWKASNERVIPIKDLEDEHLDNIIQMLSSKKEKDVRIKASSLNFY